MADRRVVLITGCSSGIGRALALGFSGAGHRVIATARQPASISDLEGPDVLVEQLDVTVGASIRRAVGVALDRTGRIDILVNNAGYGLMGPTAELDPNDLRLQLETNVVGPVALIRAVVPGMAERGWGRIVNVGSVVGVTALPFSGAYCASKAALHSLSDTLRMEVAPFGVHVIVVQPGSIESRFGEHASHGLERYHSDDSLYRPIAAAIDARATASQRDPSQAAELARRIVEASLSVHPPAVVRWGRNSRFITSLRHLPVRMRDRILSRRFGIDRLKGS